jgi:hypothetical protein
MASTSTPPRPSVIPFRPAARSTTGPVPRALPPTAAATVSVTRPDAIDLTGRRKVWFFCGRGKTGKTTLARWVAERMQDLGGSAIVAACDPVNRSLRRFLEGVAEPPSSDSEEVKDWLWSLLHAAMESKSDALIDLGGGNSSLTALLAQLPDLANILSEGGVEPIAIYLSGSDPDDLTPLEIAEKQGFQPQATAIVLNEVDGRRSRFDSILRDPTVCAAVERGAVQLWMPALWPEAAALCNANAWHFRDVIGRADAFVASSVNNWLRRMEEEFHSIRTWMPS